MNVTKKTVGVFFGGKSTEHDISIITALSAVIKPLLATGKYEVVPVYIAKDGSWYSDKAFADISLFSSGRIKEFVKTQKKVLIEFNDGLVLVKQGLKNKKIRIDIAFPAMHGTYGEDGSIMGLFRMAGVAFVGCDQTASVIAMDKVLCKQVVEAAGVATTKSVHFSDYDFTKNKRDALQQVSELNYPVFVKPAHLGSSIGISRVTQQDQLENAVEVAVHYDNLVIIEEAVQNLIEVTVPIMGNEDPIPALVERPLTNGDDFFDFEAKYIREGGKKSGGETPKGAQGYSEAPAKIGTELYDLSVTTALTAYKAVGCSGMCRVDLLIDSKTKKVYFNELNPLPGSLYAHNWQRAGVSPVALVTRLIELAEAHHESQRKLQSTFSTNFLKQF